MPLSDDEQRILRQIEEQLQHDEQFATKVSPAGLYRHSRRIVAWSVLGAVASLAATVLLLAMHFLLAFAGFLVMLAFVLVIERQLRAISKAGIKDVVSALRGTPFGAQRRGND